jgi:raffinose/stachyose/melibiose transport system substrate-binding protein
MDHLLSRREALRGFGGVCAVGLLGGGLAACGSSSSSTRSTVTAWNSHPELKAAYDAVADAFMEAHPDIVFKTAYKPVAQYNTILKTALVGGTGPDLINVNSAAIRGDTGVAGDYIAPMDREFNVEDMIEPVRHVIQFDGHTWAVPIQSLRIGLYYQKPIFRKYGLEPPRTWEDLTNIARTLKENDVPAFMQPAQDMILPFFFYELAVSSILGEAGFEKLRTGSVKLTDADLVRAAQYVVDLVPYYNEGFQAVAFAESKALFAQGRGAMTVAGTSDYVGFKAANPDAELGFFGFPSPDGSAPPVDLSGFSFGFTLNKRAGNEKAARAYIAWAGSEEGQRQVLEKIGLPGRKGLSPKGSDPRSVLLRDALAVSETQFWLDYPETAGTLDAATKSGSGVFTGDLSPEQFAAVVQKAIVPSKA